VDLDHNY